jgi:HK97 family phage portal protein
MGVFDKARTSFRNWMLQDAATRMVYEGWSGGQTASGIDVSESKALSSAAVWAAVNALSSSVASLPVDAYKRLPNGDREKETASDLQWVLHEQPNEDMTPYAWKETIMVHLLLRGNAYCEIIRSDGGRLMSLEIIHPDAITPKRNDTGMLVYEYKPFGKDAVTIPASRILHFAGMGFDGVVGYSVLAKAKESIGLGLATEKYGSTFFGNGAWPGLVATHPDKMTPEAIARLKAGWESLHKGPDRAHKLAVLEGGMKLDRVTINPEDSQFLQTREFQIEEVARWFHLPPHKLGHKFAERPGGSIEAQNIEFVTDSLMPWLRRIEQELTRKLVTYRERPGRYVEFNVNALLRGDIKSRFDAYAVAKTNGWLSVNEIRRMENMNDIGPEGDEFGTPAPAAPPPAPEPQDDPEDDVEDAPEDTSDTSPQDEAPARNVKLALAQRAIAKDALGRLVRAEVGLVRKAIEKGTPISDVYTKHSSKMVEVLRPVVAAHEALVGSDAEPDLAVRGLVEAYIKDALSELDRSPDVEATLSSWEQNRADSVADALFQKEVLNDRS